MEVPSYNKAPGPWERRLVGAFVRGAMGFRRKGARPPIRTQIPWTPLRLAGNSGANLSARWFPADEPVGTVVLAHPDRRSGQNWFLPRGWIEFLLDARQNVLTFDFAGYGDSRGGSTYLLEDVVAATQEARRRTPHIPIHLAGVSIGAFSAINAAPHLPFLSSLTLESPFPTFNAWYGRGWGRLAMAAFDRIFPRTAAIIQADRNIARAAAPRILIAASRDDRVTPVDLTRRVARAARPERTTYLEIEGAPHLGLFEESPIYREAILRTISPSEAIPAPPGAPLEALSPIPA